MRLVNLAWPGLLKCNPLDEIYERIDEVENSRRTRILTKFTAVALANAEWRKISVCSVANGSQCQ